MHETTKSRHNNEKKDTKQHEARANAAAAGDMRGKNYG